MRAAPGDDLRLRASPDVHARTRPGREMLHCVTPPRHVGVPLHLVDLLQFGVLTPIVPREVGMIWRGRDLSIDLAVW